MGLLVPGATGSCSGTISDTTLNTSTPVDVALVVNTTSSSGGHTSGSGIATEALLDGQTDGLQVTITDTSSNQTFSLGAVSCYSDSGKSTLASYPNAAYCVSSSRSQTVASNVGNASFSNDFVISWSFPLAASNPYEGGGVTIQLQFTYTGTTSGAVRGASTTTSGTTTSGTGTSGTGTSGGQLAASTGTPTTGAALPETLAKLLLGAGFLLALAGVLLYLRGQWSRPFQPPTVSS
jgi:hypothetical protein